jgi:hypothetical protein
MAKFAEFTFHALGRISPFLVALTFHVTMVTLLVLARIPSRP